MPTEPPFTSTPSAPATPSRPAPSKGQAGTPGPAPRTGHAGAVRIYTDGACIGGGRCRQQTTNNRMELTAACEALGALPPDTPAVLYSDSKYLIDGATTWLDQWTEAGWQTTAGTPVKNRDLWNDLARHLHRPITWLHVRGHSGVAGNERADAIAQAFARGANPLPAASPEAAAD